MFRDVAGFYVLAAVLTVHMYCHSLLLDNSRKLLCFAMGAKAQHIYLNILDIFFFPTETEVLAIICTCKDS